MNDTLEKVRERLQRIVMLCARPSNVDHIETIALEGAALLRTLERQGLQDPLMQEAWDLTTGDRQNQYGSAVDAFRAYGHIWTGLLAHKLKEDAVINSADVAIMMTGLKLGREVRSSKRDNVVDAHGYLSHLARIRGWFKS